ncbi:MAG: HlyD family efflux transporter periplasmic adaptor subunit [Deltaproteobacteria bacterium]|nr:HlyD family efflux transporter periplasmic adaptor subunit [Deltaproteobacteria bacterium]
MLTEVQTAAQAAEVRHALDLARRVAYHDNLGRACEALRGAVQELCDADRAHVVLCDVTHGVAWRQEQPDLELPLQHGLVAHVVRHGRAWATTHAAADQGYYRPLDDPAGTGREAMLLHPVWGRTGEIHAVLVAVRREGRLGFSSLDLFKTGVLANAVGSSFDQLAWRAEAEALIAQDPDQGRLQQARRSQAERSRRGDVVRVTPRWIGATFWALLVVVIACIVGLGLARTGRYAHGVAVVRAQGRTEVTAAESGPLIAVHVEPGQHVEAGQVLAQLDDHDAQAQLQRLERAYAAQLRQRMLDPNDVSGHQALAGLRREREAALESIERREIRAPVAGRVADVRLRPGQPIAAGQPVLVLVDDSRPLEVVALLPGHERPELATGMTLRLELAGYPYAYQYLAVAAVDDQVIGPAEAQRLLGPQIADSLPVQGALTVVRAPLPSLEFSTEQGPRSFHDGMQGMAELRLRDEPVVFRLLPALRQL